MRLLKIGVTAALAAVAVIAGLLVAVVVAGMGLILSLLKPRRSGRGSGPTSSIPHRAEARPVRPLDRDVIDVTATEVPADPDPTNR